MTNKHTDALDIHQIIDLIEFASIGDCGHVAFGLIDEDRKTLVQFCRAALSPVDVESLKREYIAIGAQQMIDLLKERGVLR